MNFVLSVKSVEFVVFVEYRQFVVFVFDVAEDQVDIESNWASEGFGLDAVKVRNLKRFGWSVTLGSTRY